MIYLWMLFALAMTVVGALLILHLDEAAREHEEEATYESRVTEQVASLTVAQCEADPVCASEHRHSEKRVKRHVRRHARRATKAKA